LDPTHPQTLLNRGNVLSDLGRYEEALASYAASLAGRTPEEHQERNIVHKQRGVLFAQTGQYAGADAAYAAALGEMPDDAVSYFNRSLNQDRWARAEGAAGHLAEARAHFTLALQYAQRALQLNPSDPDNQRRVALAEQALRETSGS
jgi:tetratricopeptide (TPR) repeat protein